jgi:hypothetical protein
MDPRNTGNVIEKLENKERQCNDYKKKLLEISESLEIAILDKEVAEEKAFLEVSVLNAEIEELKIKSRNFEEISKQLSAERARNKELKEQIDSYVVSSDLIDALTLKIELLEDKNNELETELVHQKELVLIGEEMEIAHQDTERELHALIDARDSSISNFESMNNNLRDLLCTREAKINDQESKIREFTNKSEIVPQKLDDNKIIDSREELKYAENRASTLSGKVDGLNMTIENLNDEIKHEKFTISVLIDNFFPPCFLTDDYQILKAWLLLKYMTNKISLIKEKIVNLIELSSSNEYIAFLNMVDNFCKALKSAKLTVTEAQAFAVLCAEMGLPNLLVAMFDQISLPIDKDLMQSRYGKLVSDFYKMIDNFVKLYGKGHGIYFVYIGFLLTKFSPLLISSDVLDLVTKYSNFKIKENESTKLANILSGVLKIDYEKVDQEWVSDALGILSTLDKFFDDSITDDSASLETRWIEMGNKFRTRYFDETRKNAIEQLDQAKRNYSILLVEMADVKAMAEDYKSKIKMIESSHKNNLEDERNFFKKKCLEISKEIESKDNEIKVLKNQIESRLKKVSTPDLFKFDKGKSNNIEMKSKRGICELQKQIHQLFIEKSIEKNKHIHERLQFLFLENNQMKDTEIANLQEVCERLHQTEQNYQESILKMRVVKIDQLSAKKPPRNYNLVYKFNQEIRNLSNLDAKVSALIHRMSTSYGTRVT